MKNIEKIIVKNGRHKGKEFLVEGWVDQDLVELAEMGNMAALNAVQKDKYTLQDLPFFYGKIDGFGYVISKEDLGELPKTVYVMPKY